MPQSTVPVSADHETSLPGVSARLTAAGDHGGVDADLVIVGGGQAGLAVAYYARRAGLRAVVLVADDRPGGAGPEDPPGRDHVVDYLTRYELRYGFDLHRPVRVTAVEPAGTGRTGLVVCSGAGELATPAVVSATGTWRRPFWPTHPGQALFRGSQLHVSGYQEPTSYVGKRVLVVGRATAEKGRAGALAMPASRHRSARLPRRLVLWRARPWASSAAGASG
jgi:cation diffusion facilitator CzcD-associated flavoprotein CzcO